MSERNRMWKLKMNKMLTGVRWSYISPWFCSMSPPAVSDPTLLCPWVLPLQASPSGSFTISKQSPALTLGAMSHCSMFFPKDMKTCPRHFPSATSSARSSVTTLSYTVTVILFPGPTGPLHWSSIFSVASITFWHRENCLSFTVCLPSLTYIF